jgi:hypothetical protein
MKGVSMKRYFKFSVPALVIVVVATFSIVGSTAAQALPCGQAIQALTVNLQSAGDYGILAGAAVTNGGTSYLNGKIGVSPGTAITGIATLYKPGSSTISSDIGNDPFTAQVDVTAANDAITAQNKAGHSPIAAELGSQVVCPGIYSSDAAFGLTGVLTLDGNGSSNSVFIFMTPAALTSAAASSIVLRNGAKAKNIYWQLGAAATLGASSFFVGNILAQAAITTGAGVEIDGRLFAKAAITLDSTTIVLPS